MKKSNWEKFAIKTGKRLEWPDISSTAQMFLKMNCIYEGELKWDTVSSFYSFYFSFHFPPGPSEVQEAQMTCQKGSDMKEISNSGKAENQLLVKLAGEILMWDSQKRGVATRNTHHKDFPGYKEHCPEYLARINPPKARDADSDVWMSTEF